MPRLRKGASSEAAEGTALAPASSSKPKAKRPSPTEAKRPSPTEARRPTIVVRVYQAEGSTGPVLKSPRVPTVNAALGWLQSGALNAHPQLPAGAYAVIADGFQTLTTVSLSHVRPR